jgi:hypothetical protein
MVNIPTAPAYAAGVPWTALAVDWSASSIVLGDGAIGYETDTEKWKIGDGVHTYPQLPYFADTKANAGTTNKGQVVITDNNFAQPNGSLQSPGSTRTQEFYNTVGIAACDIRLVYGQYQTQSGGAESDAGVTCLLSSAFKDAAGNVYQVTFGGAKSITLASGGIVVSDPIGVDVAVGDLVATRTFLTTGSSSYYQSRQTQNLTNGGGTTITTDLTPTGSGAVTQGQGFGFAPLAIIGTPTGTGTPKAVVLQGDSIMMGLKDGVTTSQTGYYPPAPWLSGGGWAARALSGQAGYVQIAMSSEGLNNFILPTKHYRRSNFIKYARYCFNNYSINDFTAGQTSTQLSTNQILNAQRNAARGIIKTVVTTICPHTTSTDRWTTTTNQTLNTSGQNTQRIAYNQWVRAGGPIDPTTLAPVAPLTAGALLFGSVGHPIAGYLDIAAVVETAIDSGFWKGPLRTVTDGAMTSTGTTLTSATGAFTSADRGRDIIVAGAGAAGADLIAVITTVTDSTHVVLSVAASTTVSGATTLIAPITCDGLHPFTYANLLIATAVGPVMISFMSTP